MRKQETLSPPTPAQVLRERLLPGLEITQAELADALGVSRLSVNQLLNDKRAISAEMALRLARAFSTTARFWLDLQKGIDLYRASAELEEELRSVRVLRKPIPEHDLFRDVGD